ncbi:tRNA (guanine-N(7)-)-methyltransferase [Striga asiatica]|uniref:tRNA (Guanine-N(7)-)-methyltransferase n=1 Tax=Striga asiatica TaxID=4170 RepID=A0A5A7R961_STRAF|nr:tRNA (guanine-N(7)-)-methyltransferase [Striga asiatica]
MAVQNMSTTKPARRLGFVWLPVSINFDTASLTGPCWLVTKRSTNNLGDSVDVAKPDSSGGRWTKWIRESGEVFSGDEPVLVSIGSFMRMMATERRGSRDTRSSASWTAAAWWLRTGNGMKTRVAF